MARNFGLDLARSIAIVGVVLAHGTGFLPALQPPASIGWTIASFGGLGVDLFFVLSGLLVGTLLLREAETPQPPRQMLARFWTRRWWRILPTFYLFVALNVVAGALAIRPAPLDLTVVGFVQNLWDWHRHNLFMPEAWSLAVEEWFYLAAPLLLLAFRRAGMAPARALLWTGLAMIVASTVIRSGLAIASPPPYYEEWWVRMRTPVIVRLDSIGIGVLLAWLHTQRPDSWNRWRRVAGGLGAFWMAGGLACMAYLYHPLVFYWPVPAPLAPALLANTLLNIGFAGLIWYLSGVRPPREWFRRWTATVAKASYAWYLCHMLVLATLQRASIVPVGNAWTTGALAMAVFVVLSFLVAHWVYLSFERHMTARRDVRHPRGPEEAGFNGPGGTA